MRFKNILLPNVLLLTLLVEKTSNRSHKKLNLDIVCQSFNLAGSSTVRQPGTLQYTIPFNSGNIEGYNMASGDCI